MLTSVSINGYRQFSKFAIDDLKRFNLLVGPNNSGKSSLLEAIFLHCGPLHFQIILAILSCRLGGFVPDPAMLFEQIKLFFNISDQKIGKIVVTSKWDKKVRETTLSLVEGAIGSPFLQEMTSSEGSPNIILMPQNSRDNGGLLIGSVVLGFGIESQKNKEIKIDLIAGQPLRIGPPRIKTDISAVLSDPFMHRKPESGIEEYSRAIKKGHHEKIIGLLRKLDTHIKDIIILTGNKRPQLFVDYEGNGLMPLSNLGDGIRRIMLIASQIAICENGVILIDELDSSIHERALRKFVNWLIEVCEETNVQLFATTHSLECVDTVIDSNLFKLSELNLFKMSQRNNTIQAQKVAGENLKEIRYELGQDVRG